eukprot:CAMPEP_0197720838 /NCGR_PEP_ID=MMETSP1434-20131217/4091_1 /TAXON_ID=265543 /ORGANISM="Minutocellus polymorphus, Strain CCMP3303" /LENGTH=62 /DNA_ID=CAMNT_0043305761 /DNA_START=136 /DNA_END=321 /DNA_ORIENTATION=+
MTEMARAQTMELYPCAAASSRMRCRLTTAPTLRRDRRKLSVLIISSREGAAALIIDGAPPVE